MSIINQSIQEELSKSLYLYYDSIRHGNLDLLPAIMTEESYLMTLDSFGTRRAFQDKKFKKVLESINTDQSSIDKVVDILSSDLAEKASNPKIKILEFEPNGSERITLHYTQDEHAKKFYFSLESGQWKINYMAGRKVN